MYLALGDGGNANDVGPSHIVPGGNAQNLSTPLGKMLRFDPLNPGLNPSSPDPISPNGQYRIPTSNPFQGPGQVPEIYAYGLRNPYRFCFDPVTGDLIEADVGQNNVEEINRIVHRRQLRLGDQGRGLPFQPDQRSCRACRHHRDAAGIFQPGSSRRTD